MYNRKQIKAEAKECLNKNFGVALGTLVVYGLIGFAAAYIPFAAAILSGVLITGVAKVFLSIVRRAPLVEFSNMFDGFKNFGTTCISGILVAIYTFLWSLLFIIPGIIKAYSYSMTFYILADHPELTASQAIAASQKMMDGHKWDFFVLELSFIGWYLLSFITFGLAMIYAAPYMAAANAKFYDTIKYQIIE